MSEAVAAMRIRAGRATCRFLRILGMVARGELHLSGIHQLAGHLTDENYEEVIPDGDAAAVIERALDALLTQTKKKKAARIDALFQLEEQVGLLGATGGSWGRVPNRVTPWV